MTNQTGSLMPPEALKNALQGRIDNDFGYHKATPETGPMHDAVRAHFKELAYWLVANTPFSREQSLMLTELQNAQMWANAAIACNLSPLEGPSA